MIPATSSANYLFLLAEPFLQIVGAIALSILPAWGLATRLKLDPLTKLLVAVMGSYTLMYLLEFGSYLFSAPKWLPLSLLLIVSLASSIYTNLKWRKSPGTTSFPWDGVISWVGLVVWIVGFQSRIVIYGAVYWYGDWYEHYERAIFFMDQLSPDTRFLQGGWSLPARGPMFNASAALLMSLFGRDFWVYQTMATVLNTFAVLPTALLIRDMARIGQVSALLCSSLLFGIAPFAVQQETFTWTKFFAVGFILGGIHLYRTGLTQKRPWLAGWSFGAFATGILAHYMVLVFSLFFMAHFLCAFTKKRWDWRAVVYPAMACSALLATWFAYLVMTLGLQTTLTANSALGDVKLLALPEWKNLAWYETFLGNMINTTLPYSWRHGITGIGNAPHIFQRDLLAGPQLLPLSSELNRKREWLADLASNQSSLLGNLGWAGGVAVLITAVLWIRERRKGSPTLPTKSPPDHDPPAPEPGWLFWLLFFILGIPLNILTVRFYSPLGLAHLNLQPFICLTAVLLLRWLRNLPTFAKAFLLAVFFVESALTTGTLLTLQERPVPIVRQADGTFLVIGKLGLDPNYLNNYMYKLSENAVFISDRLGDLTTPMSWITVVIAICLLVVGLLSLSSLKSVE